MQIALSPDDLVLLIVFKYVQYAVMDSPTEVHAGAEVRLDVTVK